MNRDRWNPHSWNMVTDHKGVPVGHYQAPSELLREQVQVVRNFLISISKRKDREMAQTQTTTEQKTEKTNMVFLAGTLKFTPRVFDDNTRCLIDVGQKSCVQCSIYTGDKAPAGNAELAEKLKRFSEGDFIQVVAMLRPYGVKKGETWTNNVSIDITTIKTEPPQRQRKQGRSDDDIPF